MKIKLLLITTFYCSMAHSSQETMQPTLATAQDFLQKIESFMVMIQQDQTQFQRHARNDPNFVQLANKNIQTLNTILLSKKLQSLCTTQEEKTTLTNLIEQFILVTADQERLISQHSEPSSPLQKTSSYATLSSRTSSIRSAK